MRELYNLQIGFRAAIYRLYRYSTPARALYTSIATHLTDRQKNYIGCVKSLNKIHATFIISSHLEDLPARLLVGDAHGDLPPEAAARPQRRVDRLQPARRTDHEHALSAAAGGVCAAIASALGETRGVELVD